MWRDPALALDILLAAEDALSFTAGLDRTGFRSSKLHQSHPVRLAFDEAQGRKHPRLVHGAAAAALLPQFAARPGADR
jgi:hypothetical protein